MFDWLNRLFNTNTKEYGWQLYIHDDNSFEFRKLELEDTLLIVKKNGKTHEAFKDYYKLRFPFNGYKNIPAGLVTLGYARDSILDPFDILTDEDGFTKKTKKTDASKDKTFNLNRPWITEIANNACYKAEQKKGQSVLLSKFEWALSIALGLQALALFIMVVT